MSPRFVFVLALLLLGTATAFMLAGLEPVAGWFYLFAWYPTIVIADSWGHAHNRGTPFFLARPSVLFSLLAWSAVFWFSFELWNLHLENWYYVNVCDQRALRWTGTVLAFATVLPGLFAIAKLLKAYGIGDRVRGAAIGMTPGRLRLLVAMGIVSTGLVLLWPRHFFPLVWGIVFFLVAPFNYRRGKRGLLRQIEMGQWGTTIRLLGAGAICGILWELFNIRAGAKWIYTVPGLDELKLFEMPLLGFLGFPPFALECYEMYEAAVSLGVARDWEGMGGKTGRDERWGRGGRVAGQAAAGFIAVAICGLALVSMDRSTIDSMTARPADLPAVDVVLEERLARLGVRDAAELRLLLAHPAGVSKLGIGEEARVELADQVELALLRGIGSPQAARLVAIGVTSVEELASIELQELERRLEAAFPAETFRPARLRVWIRAAQDSARGE